MALIIAQSMSLAGLRGLTIKEFLEKKREAILNYSKGKFEGTKEEKNHWSSGE